MQHMGEIPAFVETRGEKEKEVGRTKPPRKKRLKGGR